MRAVDNVNLSIAPGEIVGLAGESGCGKSTLANALMQILRPPAQISGGQILFSGDDMTTKSREELRKFRWRNVSMVFQSAMNSLNPVMRVGDQFVDMMQAHERISKKQALKQAGELLEVVGIDARRIRSYPHQLSGGMRQRVIIAMALALRPELVIMDEPTTALDVVVQREILQQVETLKHELGFAVLFITHDLSLLIEVANRIAIMYAGEIVEEAPADEIHRAPRHPYTIGLMQSFPPLTGPDRADGRDPRGTALPRQTRPVGLPVPSALSSALPASRTRFALSPADDRAGPQLRVGLARTIASRAISLRLINERHAIRARGHRPHQALSRPGRLVREVVCPRGRRRQLHAPAGNDHRARRRERQRQEHGRAAARPPLCTDERPRRLRRAMT